MPKIFYSVVAEEGFSVMSSTVVHGPFVHVRREGGLGNRAVPAVMERTTSEIVKHCGESRGELSGFSCRSLQG